MKIHFLLVLSCLLAYTAVQAENPIIKHIFTADPAPMVYKNTVYLYTGHDTAAVGVNTYKMPDWHVFSTKDMVHWADHGACLNDTTFSWVSGGAFAAQCIERNGKFYYYVSATHKNIGGHGGCGVGVAVSDKPTGPFRDAIGKALITNDMTTDMRHSWDDLDPTVFIDDDNQAYLFWGNGSLKMAKLKENMVELDGPITTIKPEHFTEAPWLYKRKGLYYLVYAANMPETIEYCTAPNPMGPWTYRGLIQKPSKNSFTTHPGIIEFKGKSYFFSHNGVLPTGGGYRRSVFVEELTYNADGTIQPVVETTEGVKPVKKRFLIF